MLNVKILTVDPVVYPDLHFSFGKERGQKKTGLRWKNSQVADLSPAPPSLGIFTFFYRFFLPFHKPLNWEKTEKNIKGVWVRALPPLWEFPPHNPVFFSEHVPNSSHLAHDIQEYEKTSFYKFP